MRTSVGRGSIPDAQAVSGMEPRPTAIYIRFRGHKMERQALLEEVIDYFAYSDHWHRLCSVLPDPDPQGSHLHAYVKTSVHPDSLETIMTGYFDRLGWPFIRKIDHMSPKAGMGSLHGIEPEGKLHFDFQWFFQEDVGLRPLDGGESGCNLLVWNRWYINQYYRQFPFREFGKDEKNVVEAYFKSNHFMKGLEFPVMPTTCHMHINVHSSVHPDVIQPHAEEALRREGFQMVSIAANWYLWGRNRRWSSTSDGSLLLR